MCADLRHCHFLTGTCLSGCEPGYLGEDCNKGKEWSENDTLFLYFFIYRHVLFFQNNHCFIHATE